MGKYDYELNTKLRTWAFIPRARERITYQLVASVIIPGSKEVRFHFLLL